MSTVPPPGPARRAPGRYHGAVGGRALLLAAVLLAGCRLGVRRQARDPALEALRACDAPLADGPADPARFDAHLQCLLEADDRFPDDSRVYGAIAGDLYHRALAWPDPARDDLTSARSWAMRCLTLRAEVAGRLEASGGRVDAHVLERVPAEDAGCLAWATLSQAHWLHARGVAGAAIDLEALLAMGDRLVQVAPDLERGRAWEARGVARGIVPAPLSERFSSLAEGEPRSPAQGAALDLTEARRRASDRLGPAVAMAELVYGPAGDEVAWRRTLEAVVAARGARTGVDAVEDAAAQRRAAELLLAGPPAPDRW